jgi:hypothetical protein
MERGEALERLDEWKVSEDNMQIQIYQAKSKNRGRFLGSIEALKMPNP